MRYYNIYKIFENTTNLVFRILSPNFAKYITELRYQKNWSKFFQEHPKLIQEYWEKYRFLNEIKQIVPFKNTTVLDVGCGLATILNTLEAKKKVGVDPLADYYKKMFKYAKDVEVKCAYAENLPFSTASFDVVISSNMLDHTTSPEQTINEIWRVLKPNGKLVLTVEVSSHKNDPAHPHVFTLERVMELLKGFTIEFKRKMLFVGYAAHYKFGAKALEKVPQNEWEHIFVLTKK